jgi:hypothetical protein
MGYVDSKAALYALVIVIVALVLRTSARRSIRRNGEPLR